MPNRHEIHAFDYVNRPYEAVRDALLANPLTVFQQATNTAALRNEPSGTVEFHATAGPIDVGAEVAIELVGVEAGRSPDDQPATMLEIRWKAVRRAGLFPTMEAILSLYALSPTETQLDFAGVYEPPLGLVGDAVDAIGMHAIAKESVAGFVRDLAAFLRASQAA